MESTDSQIGFGGGCHWCTEAVFQALKGVIKVEQGWIASDCENNIFSEAVIVHFNSDVSIKTLIEVHLLTHNSTSNHSMRKKYRSAIYTFSEEQLFQAKAIVADFQNDFEDKIITNVYPFKAFKPSGREFQNYYLANPSKPFCKRYIEPKLKLIMNNFAHNLNRDSIEKYKNVC